MSIDIVVLLCLFALFGVWVLVLFGAVGVAFLACLRFEFRVIVGWLTVLLLMFEFALRFWVWVVRGGVRVIVLFAVWVGCAVGC